MANLTGPEHYMRAEDLLRQATDPRKDLTDTERMRMLAEAQVHATLAQVCASVYNGGTSAEDRERWRTRSLYTH